MKKYLLILLHLTLCLGCLVTCLTPKELTLDDIFVSHQFDLRLLPGFKWVPLQKEFSYLEKDSADENHQLWRYTLKTGARTLLFQSDSNFALVKPLKEKRFKLDNYFWFPDGKRLLFPSDTALYVYDLRTKKPALLFQSNAPLRDPQISPDGQKIAYLKEYNLSVFDLTTRQEIQLTTEGKENFWIGRFDWVYEEEFGIRTGFFWSPDSRYLAFFQVDARHESPFPIVDFIPTHNQTTTMLYPKAGDRNALVKIGVVDVLSQNIRWMNTGADTDVYLPRIQWLNQSNGLIIYHLNRNQNTLRLVLANPVTGESRLILTEQAEHGWISVNSDLTFFKDDSHFLWRSDRDNWSHIYLYQIDGTLVRQITSGNWEVNEILGLDETTGFIYFIGNRETPLEAHLYRIRLDGSDLTLLTAPGYSHSIKMAEGFDYFLDYQSNANQATQIRLHQTNGDFIRLIEANELPALKEFSLPPKEFLTVPADDGVLLNAFIIKPGPLEPDRKYPVLIYCYGGPGSQIVRNKWGSQSDLWHRRLAQQGFIIFGIDNRGTGGRGAQFMKQVYRRLGEFEVADHIQAVKFLRSLPYVDDDRIGIWGWSYGGFTTTTCLLRGNDYFKMGVAVAPVTDWRNYDTIYTERYLDQPQDNPSGYEQSSALAYADQLHGKLLLIHGTADDNVHLSNTMQLAYELQKAGKVFSMMIYPQKDHGISDVKRQLFETMTDFIRYNL